MSTWATIGDARNPGLWPDAGSIPDAALQTCLDTSQEVCQAYAPAITDTDPVPVRYTQAVILQAREHWQAYRREGEVLGFESTAITVRPLRPAVSQLLRPRRGVPVFAVDP